MAMSPRLLRPRQTIHPETASWASRVVANGASVSGATLSAVDKFVKACYANNIRDRFYRLNLFAGGGGATDPTRLNAALVPLFRGPSQSGTQYGHTTDTNSGGLFVTTDYVERGTGGGLQGSRTSLKRLNTGVLGSTLSGHNFHCSSYEIVGSDTSFDNSLGCWTSTGGQGFYFGTQGASSSYGIEYPGNNQTYTPASVTGHFMAVQTGSKTGAIYRNGSVGVTSYFGATDTTNDWSGLTWDITVFAGQKNAAGTYGEYSSARLGAYSFGIAMNATQASAFYAAMQTFQTALTRNV